MGRAAKIMFVVFLVCAFGMLAIWLDSHDPKKLSKEQLVERLINSAIFSFRTSSVSKEVEEEVKFILISLADDPPLKTAAELASIDQKLDFSLGRVAHHNYEQYKRGIIEEFKNSLTDSGATHVPVTATDELIYDLYRLTALKIFLEQVNRRNIFLQELLLRVEDRMAGVVTEM